MAKYIRVVGLYPDEAAIVYDLDSYNLANIFDEVAEFVLDGGDMSEVKLEILEMAPAQFRKLEEA